MVFDCQYKIQKLNIDVDVTMKLKVLGKVKQSNIVD